MRPSEAPPQTRDDVRSGFASLGAVLVLPRLRRGESLEWPVAKLDSFARVLAIQDSRGPKPTWVGWPRSAQARVLLRRRRRWDAVGRPWVGDTRDRAQVLVDRFELAIRHLAVDRPGHHLQNRRAN